MKNLIDKTKITATIVMVLLITSAIMLMTNTPVQAQDGYTNMQEGGSIPLPAGVTPDLRVETVPYLSFRPTTIGINQIFLVNMWLTPPPHVARYYSDFKVTITKPSGEQHVVTMDSYRGDGTAWFEWIADEVGTWKLKLDFPGGYFPAGNYTVYGGAFVGPQVNSFDETVYYEPSSTGEQTLIVQEDIAYSWPDLGLPTDYWTRPVSPEHRDWWPILGNYPATGIVGGGSNWPTETNIYTTPTYDFTPYVQAPNTAHVVWKRQGDIAGLIGGTMGQTSFEARVGTPNIIYAGRCYDTYQKMISDEFRSTWRCYDLRTGEVYWETPVTTTTSMGFFGPMTVSLVPTMLYYGTEARATVPGGGAYPGTVQVELMYVGGGRLIRYDPWDGHVTFNMSIAPLSTGTYYNTYPFFLTVQNLGGGNRRLINWTISGTHVGMAYRYDYSLGVVNNITWPWSNLGSVQDFESGIAVTVSSITPPATGSSTQTRLTAVSMITGAELWDTTIDERIYSGSCSVADHGKVAVLSMNGYFLAYDLQTGNLAWKSEAMDYPWGQPAFGAYDITSAYGMLYRQAYDGVYAFDWDDGKRVWKYQAPTPYEFETPYIDENGESVYSFNSGAFVADGKLFTVNSEHTTTEPITRGWKIHCIDAYTGEGIWNMTGQMSPGAVADGYLTASSSYDGYMYVFGKGQSATTVTATPKTPAQGATVLIEGTVLDQSPAQSSTPCVSKESMALQMEYLHMQHPIAGVKGDGIIEGVPVKLTAIGSDGNYIDIGTTTTSGYYGTFGLAWTPTEEGTYEIIASFEGDDSYGSSAAATVVSVGPAASASVPIEPATESTLLTTVAIIAAVAIVAVVAVVGFWILKKRK